MKPTYHNNNNNDHQTQSLEYLISDLLPFRTTDSTAEQDTALALLLPLLILLSTLLFLLLLFLIFLIIIRRRRAYRRSPGSGPLRLDDGPLDLSHSDQFDDFNDTPVERRWLESCDEPVRMGYLRAKMYQTQYRPNSLPTDITLSQFLSIQEKGVSAWAFEPDYSTNPSLPVIVQSRTEISFLSDGDGLSPAEGGAVCVQSNLPLPKLNEVYYFESKIFELAPGTELSIGLATKPYPSFRLPGWNRLSIGYFASDGFKSHNYPFAATSYGPPLKQGDVLGVGYKPRTGSVFFTRNGKKLEDAYIGLQRFNVFPTIGATGHATIHVNLGQAGFVFIEANVKKWGLAPMSGTLAPPPAYGHQTGSILLATSDASRRHRETRSGNSSDEGGESNSSSGTIRPRDLDLNTAEEDGDGTESESDHLPHNPPTPRPLDISLRQMRSDRSASPPNYAPIDPYKYAAGVAEVMLSEQFGGSSSDWRANGIRGSTSTSYNR